MLGDFTRKTLEYSKKYNLILSGECIGIGLSGGADSTTLACVLIELSEIFEYRLMVLHLNHRLREDESDGD